MNAYAATIYNLSSAPSPAPRRHSSRTPRQYLALKQHQRVLTHEEELMKYAQTLDWDYRVKIPKPLYREATEARRQSIARNAKKLLTYAITPTAPKGRKGGGGRPAESEFLPPPMPAGRPSYNGQGRREEEYTLG